MNLRQAILKAADLFEVSPETYSFMSCEIPECGTPGCVLGWVGVFAEAPERIDFIYGVANDLLEISEMTFYNRMDDIAGHAWKIDATECAKTLRLYADKFHPEEPATFPTIAAELARIFQNTREVA